MEKEMHSAGQTQFFVAAEDAYFGLWLRKL